MLQQDQDYVVYDETFVATSKQPMKHSYATLVATKNKLFLVPTKTIGLFLILDTIKTHSFFQGVPISEGVRKIIASANTIEELEDSFSALLQDDPKYVYVLEEWPIFKFQSFLGKHTLRLAKGGFPASWTAIGVKGRALSKQFRTFYGH